ncbi:hypothetical protein OG571_47680 (plasmid) [Streptomyces sp. NBC_01369]|uniref:hypothetical protein n=1 Tax=Streptomyces sp. NBC_01369 TaxID=2903842 RepID=UPI003252A5F3
MIRHEEQAQATPLHLEGPDSYEWYTLPEHYGVCRICRELPPCRHVHNDAIMDRASERMAKDMAIMPGVCHGCREPITKRQKTFAFPGPNLIRPDLGNDSAIFHTRRDCLATARSYDERWAAAEPQRTRLLYCEGTVTVHHDESRECDSLDCKAKNIPKGLVQHQTGIWHHPKGGRVTQGCWCLASANT